MLSPDLHEPDDVLAEDEGVGSDGAEHEHDAGQQPDRQSCGPLKTIIEFWGKVKVTSSLKGKTTSSTHTTNNRCQAQVQVQIGWRSGEGDCQVRVR